jgi:hypothetical protein
MNRVWGLRAIGKRLLRHQAPSIEHQHQAPASRTEPRQQAAGRWQATIVGPRHTSMDRIVRCALRTPSDMPSASTVPCGEEREEKESSSGSLDTRTFGHQDIWTPGHLGVWARRLARPSNAASWRLRKSRADVCVGPALACGQRGVTPVPSTEPDPSCACQLVRPPAPQSITMRGAGTRRRSCCSACSMPFDECCMLRAACRVLHAACCILHRCMLQPHRSPCP